jgi:hypothetical protein
VLEPLTRLEEAPATPAPAPAKLHAVGEELVTFSQNAPVKGAALEQKKKMIQP